MSRGGNAFFGPEFTWRHIGRYIANRRKSVTIRLSLVERILGSQLSEASVGAVCFTSGVSAEQSK